MASQGMILRNMHLVGLTKAVPMPQNHKPMFEEGVALLFQRWTALQLAVQNEWGGSSSKEKANHLLEEVIHWFYTTKDHEQNDLEELLDEALQVDFNVQAEDDSPYQVARSLVNLHNQVAGGDASFVQSLRQQMPSSAAASKPADGETAAQSSSSSDDDGDEEGDEAEGMDAEGGDDMEMEDAQQVGNSAQQQGPVVDDEGFQVVTKRKGRGRN